MQIISYLNNFKEVKTLNEADNLLISTLEKVGIEKFSYNFYLNHANPLQQSLYILCTHNASAWQDHYVNQQYGKIDPIFNRMRTSQLPLIWQVEDELNDIDQREQKQLFLDAIDFGMRGGFGVPIHTAYGEFANFVVQDASIIKQINKQPQLVHELQLISFYYHASVNKFVKPVINFKLTAREKECLALSAQHKTAKQIAKLLNISPRTVSFHIENVIRKLGVANKYQAISVLKSSHCE